MRLYQLQGNLCDRTGEHVFWLGTELSMARFQLNKFEKKYPHGIFLVVETLPVDMGRNKSQP